MLEFLFITKLTEVIICNAIIIMIIVISIWKKDK